MEPLVFVLVLLAAVLHASWNALAKMGGDPWMRLALVAGSSSLCAMPLLGLVDAPAPESWPFLVCSVLVHQAYYAFLMFAYREGDLSAVYPIARGLAPVFVAVGAWFLAGEHLDPLALMGVAVVALGIASLAFGKELRCCGGRPALGAFFTAVAIAGYSVADGLGGRAAGNVLGYAVHLTVWQGLPLTLLMLIKRRATLREDLAQHGRSGVAAGALSFIAYALVIWAMSRTPLSYVAALREVAVIVGAFLGTRLLGEPSGARRIAAATTVAIGIVILQFGRGA